MNIGKRSKEWRTWRAQGNETVFDPHDPYSNYYDDDEFINETQRLGSGITEMDCDLSGIPQELWPEVTTGKKPGTALTESNRSPVSVWPSSTYVFEKCHEGNILIFNAENISVYGGGKTRGLKIWEDAFFIDMGDVVDEKYVQFAGCFYPELYIIKLVKVACKDFGSPSVGTIFWTRLVDILKRESADRKLNVVCCCQGGHGRTGVALTILASLLEVVPVKDCPVKWVRDRYCKYAVESINQIEYIKDVTGREVKEKEAESKWKHDWKSDWKGGSASKTYGCL